MRKSLIVHDDMIISRIAHEIESLTRSIDLLESIQSGTCKRTEYSNVDMKQVADRLELKRQRLDDLLEEIEDGLFTNELKAIHRKYVIGGNTK